MGNLMNLRLREQVRVRENVRQNIKSLKSGQRKALWEGIRSLVCSDVFQVQKALSWSLAVKTREGLTRVGVFLRKGVVALVKVILPRRLVELLSVIDLDRVARSKKDVSGDIIDERSTGAVHYRVRVSAIDKSSLIFCVESPWIENGFSSYMLTLAGSYARKSSSRKFQPA